MARITLVEPDGAPPATRAAYDQIRDEWGGTLLTDFFLLGHSPVVAMAISRLFLALQGEHGDNVSDMADKELVALRTSWLNGCAYCVGHNVDLGRAVGLTTEEIDAAISPHYEQSATLTLKQKALLRWTTAVTKNTASEDDAALEALQRFYSDPEIAELTLVSGLFNMWNRMTETFKIPLEPRAERDLTACLVSSKPIRPHISLDSSLGGGVDG